MPNVLRIVTVVYLAATWQVDVASGWSHEALGPAALAVALGLTASTDNLFFLVADFRALPEEDAQDLIDEPGAELAAGPPAPTAPISHHSTAMPTRLTDLRRTVPGSWPLAAADGALLVARPLLVGKLLQDYFVPGSITAARLPALRAGDLPASWEGAFQQRVSRPGVCRCQIRTYDERARNPTRALMAAGTSVFLRERVGDLPPRLVSPGIDSSTMNRARLQSIR